MDGWRILLAYAAKLPPRDPICMREGIVKDISWCACASSGSSSETISHPSICWPKCSAAGEQEAVRSFSRINNQHLRELSHLHDKVMRIPLELFRKMRQQEGLKLSGF